MRTTITFEPDVAAMLRQRLKTGNASLKQVVNEALRRGLDENRETRIARKPFQVTPWTLGLNPGIDFDRINQHLDHIDAIESREKFLK